MRVGFVLDVLEYILFFFWLVRTGAHAWSLLFPSIPEKFQKYHDDGYKLVSDLDTPVPTSFLCSFISLCPVAIYLLARKVDCLQHISLSVNSDTSFALTHN
jgi:hypothetical protein